MKSLLSITFQSVSKLFDLCCPTSRRGPVARNQHPLLVICYRYFTDCNIERLSAARGGCLAGPAVLSKQGWGDNLVLGGATELFLSL